MPPRARFLRPESIFEAVALYCEHGPKARYIAGGTDVLVEESLQSDLTLISLRRLAELREISLDDTGSLHVGSMVRIVDLENYLYADGKYEALAEAIAQIGSPQIRNAATIGGNVCSSLPSADSIGPLLIYDAQLVLDDGKTARTVAMGDFCTGPGKNVKEAHEILREIVLPDAGNALSAYVKHGRRNAMEIALTGASCFLRRARGSGLCEDLRVALTTSAPTHVRARHTEEYLAGKALSRENIVAAAALAGADARPRTSFRCTSEYRLSVIPVLVERAIETAMARGNGYV